MPRNKVEVPPRTKAPAGWVRRIVAVLVPVLVSWFALELLGQSYFGKPYYYGKFQFAYDSPDPYVNVAPGLWTYRPNATIDEVVVYKKPFGSYFEESSCRYDIDDTGFSGNEKGRRDYDILLLGASYTAGNGGCPWTDELRRRLPGVGIYNAGVPGSGLRNWALAESYLLERGFHFRHLFLLLTSGDFFRLRDNVSDEDIRCLHDIAECSPRDYAYPLLPGMDLLAVSKARNDKGFSRELAYFWRRDLWVSFFLVQTVGGWLHGERAAIDETATKDFDRILSAGPQVHVIRVTTKDEAALRSRNAWSHATDGFLDSRGIAYDRCPLDYRDFLEFDPHPTHAGYVRLAECLTRLAAGIPGMKSPVAATGQR